MVMPVRNLTIYKSQNKEYNMSVAGSGGTVDITSDTIAFYVREVVDGDPVITKTTADTAEIEKTSPATGGFQVKLLPADTSSLAAGRYYYDIWWTESATSKQKPILTGYFWIQSVAPAVASQVRSLLDEGGELRVMSSTDEIIQPSTTTVLYTSRRRIKAVGGVWELGDENHTGTNYYTGGGFDEPTGKIWLGTVLADLTEVRVDYTWESGLDDDAIYQHLESSRRFVNQYTGIEFKYGAASTQKQQGAEAMAFARTIISCILTINGANVAQMGYNFRLDEFEIQTKLWGEGMIAEALFGQYRAAYEEWKMALGRAGVVLIAAPSRSKYSISDLVGYTGDNAESGEN